MNFLIIKKREEITKMTQPIVDNQYHDRFVNKLFNNPPKEPCQSAKMLNRVVDSKSNGQIYATSERDDMNSHSGNSENDKTNRINPVVSRSGPEEKVTKNERTFTLRMTDTAMPRMDIEKEEKKFFSKLPIRTWKRLRTKEPAALRPESDATNADVKEKFQKTQNETTISNDHPERVENDDVREGARATANCSDVKRNEYFRRGLLRVDKPELTSSDLKNTKESKGSNAAKRTHEQWKKRTSAK
ncbi:uncharacterized protein LOC112552710 [Pogonomyrmex barbatus]|uniref:Uncharacterized protein LOC112552710 n=1 Tax=Pogonomyrmex barbatus TaxID=144034 RepID=A0A8N1S897_9HYME|nr:uncharacterized protein LOC112552710 [Pogonomyrmex barbatus]